MCLSIPFLLAGRKERNDRDHVCEVGRQCECSEVPRYERGRPTVASDLHPDARAGVRAGAMALTGGHRYER